MSFYLLVLLLTLPHRNPGEFRHQTIFCATVFLGSCLLRPVCRSVLRRSLPWLSLEIRAFGWSAAYGAAATFMWELEKLNAVRPMRTDFLENWLPFSVVFFLWCTLYFSPTQWQQAAQERARLLRVESEAREARLSALRYQLNPHFLFNSLNAVSTPVLEGNAPAATRMLAHIGELLRTTRMMTLRRRYPFLRSLPSSSNTSPLSKPGSVAGFELTWRFHTTLSTPLYRACCCSPWWKMRFARNDLRSTCLSARSSALDWLFSAGWYS